MKFRPGSRMKICGIFICLFLFVSHSRANEGLLGVGVVGFNLATSLSPSTSLMGLASVGISQDGLALKMDEDPDRVGMKIGLGRILPDIKIKEGYTDNLTLTDTDQIGSFYTEISTHGAYVVSDKTKQFVLDYLADIGIYNQDSESNYFDNTIRAGFDYQPTSRVFGSLNSEFKLSHDPLGEGRARGGTGATQKSLDKWHQWAVGGKFAYGVPTARGRIELESGYLAKDYTTNRQFTAVRDQDNLFADARFLYRIRPKTSLTIEGRVTDYSYEHDSPGEPTLDSVDYLVLAGVTWDATYKTTGFAKAGYIFKDFDSSQRDSTGNPSWLVGIDWRPRSYSTVHLETAMTIEETDGTGDAVTTSNVLINWEHFWRSRFSTHLEFAYANSSFEPTTREDNYYGANVGADYTFRRWLSLGAEYRYQNIDSNEQVFSFDENVFELTLDVVF